MFIGSDMTSRAKAAEQLAETASVSPRTAHKAMALGASALKPLTAKRVLEAAARLGIALPDAGPDTSTPPDAA